jgi:raffinose/stachyose/melibiose transport system substrate-binding protein
MKLYDADAGKVPFTDPDLVKAAALMKQYADDGLFQPGFLGNKLNPDVQNELFENKNSIPMILIGSWGAFDWTQPKNFHIEGRKFGYFPLPPSVGDKPNVQMDVDLAVSMNKSSKHKDAAWKFIKFMVNEGYQNVLSKALQNIPAAKSVNLDKSVLTEQSEKDAVDTIVSVSEHPIGVRALENAEIENTLFISLQAMMSGKLTPQQAMEKVQEVSSKIKR